jgi:hypothetical protein
LKATIDSVVQYFPLLPLRTMRMHRRPSSKCSNDDKLWIWNLKMKGY